MTIETWKQEFYPTEADSTSKETAIAHSLRKWVGLRPENLTKHGITNYDLYTIQYKNERFDINGQSCALCSHFFSRDWCVNCPLHKHLGQDCDDENMPYSIYIASRDPEPMITALEALL